VPAGPAPYNRRDYRRAAAAIRDDPDSVCWICGGLGADTADHVVPVSRGGGNDPDNLRPAHRFCNTGRGAGRPLKARPRTPSRRW
jgi:5-methylcytosine-specific restriction protein A